MISGLTTHATFASALPSTFPSFSTSSFATASPAFAASKMSFAVSSLTFFKVVSLSSDASSFFAMRTIPVADAYCSRQPFLPQPQVSVSSSLTMMCPISPPAPFAPATIFPSTMIPPPTPVPSVTMTTSLWPFPPPCHISPSAATFASLPTFTSNPVRFFNTSATLNSPQPRLTHCNTVPSPVTGPGTPTPMPWTSSFAMPADCILPSIAAATSSKIDAPLFSVFVLISQSSISVPFISNRPILHVVPPMSTPKPYFFIF